MNTVNTPENPQAPHEPEEHRSPATPSDVAEPGPEEDAPAAAAGSPAGDADHGGDEAPAGDADRAGDEGRAGAGAPAGDESPATGREGARTALYVRRRRTPALGFWVLLSFLVPGVLALLSVPLFGFGDLRGVVNFVLLAMVVLGLPLAALASFVDARRHRGEERRRR